MHKKHCIISQVTPVVLLSFAALLARKPCQAMSSEDFAVEMLGGRCEHVTLSLTLGVLRVAGIVGKFRANMARNQRHDDRWCEFIAFDVGQKNRTIQFG